MSENSQNKGKDPINKSRFLGKIDFFHLFVNYAGLLFVLLGMIIFFSFSSEYFFSIQTLHIIANQIPELTVIAVGMTFVLIIAGIDLSVGSVMALSGMIISIAIVDWQLSFPLAVCLGMLGGLACGIINGVITVTWSIPSFIVTLGMLEMARGAAYLVTNSRTKYIGSGVDAISDPWIFGVSPAFIIALLIVIGAQLILSYSVFGRYMIGIGTNEEAMRLTGINPKPTKVIVFSIAGLMCAMGAVFHISKLEAADPNAGAGLELQAIAAVVIGGTSLMGGRGSVFTTFIGVLIISILEAGLAQIGASEPTKRFITGLVIIVAVIFDIYRNRLSSGK
ncbi:MAG: ABC transporter permease [Desulfobacteraceae bacterium]|nr:ABC transporter permease [Desulfobacteraceae bacterium]MCP4350183.1 ABC transporter permease [Desulfobacterales bacterium]